MKKIAPLAAFNNPNFDEDQPDHIENSDFEVSPSDHIKVLHPGGGRGVATIARGGSRWIEKPIPLDELEDYVRRLDGASDVFVSQQSFWGWRRISQLKHLGACYVDLDYHTTARWKGTQPETVAWSTLWHIEKVLGMPSPSYIMSTGRGLLVVWLLHETNRRACPRWSAVQKYLADGLRGFGADMKALDAARVFRVAGSQNSKADAAFVRPVWMSNEWTSLERYTFDDFANEILPFSREQLQDLKTSRAAARLARDDRYRHALAHPRNAGTYWETVLSDLQKVRQHRWWGSLPDGQRDCWLFLASNAMAWMANNQLTMRREVYALASEVGGWSHQETKSRLATVFSRSNMVFSGQKMKWRGKSVSPLYKFKSSTIIDWLEISEHEMRDANLRTLVSDRVKGENRVHAENLRRGSIDRRRSKERVRWEAGKLYETGWTQAAIGDHLGVDQRTVGRWIKSFKNNG
jgi:hypothetical protein